MHKQMLKNQSLDTKVERGHCVSAWGTLGNIMKNRTFFILVILVVELFSCTSTNNEFSDNIDTAVDSINGIETISPIPCLTLPEFIMRIKKKIVEGNHTIPLLFDYRIEKDVSYEIQGALIFDYSILIATSNQSKTSEIKSKLNEKYLDPIVHSFLNIDNINTLIEKLTDLQEVIGDNNNENKCKFFLGYIFEEMYVNCKLYLDSKDIEYIYSLYDDRYCVEHIISNCSIPIGLELENKRVLSEMQNDIFKDDELMAQNDSSEKIFTLHRDTQLTSDSVLNKVIGDLMNCKKVLFKNE